MLENFIDSLPEKIRCTDWFEEGTKFRKKDKALSFRYLELNQLYKKFIALDIDKAGAAFFWEDKGLPPPTFTVINPENAHCHYLYELNTPVYYTVEARRQPQKFYENTDLALTYALKADTAYVGKFVKNPLHPSWRTICHRVSYDLEDFQEYGLDLKSHKQKLKLAESLTGRNQTIFDTLRHWAYQEVKTHGLYAAFQEATDRKALSINQLFLGHSTGLLPAKEVLSTAKSVAKWTWKHRNSVGSGGKNRGVLELPENMPLNKKQSLAAAYANIIRTESVDEKIKAAIHTCKQRGLKIDSGNLGKCGLSMSTYYKHKEAVLSWIKLLT